MSDYYTLLGLTKSASETEIKKSYRKLAIQYHPDKSPAEKKDEYTKKFQEISEAYEVLSDPEKRKRYDMFGKDAANMEGGFGGPGMNPFDMFKDFFGNEGEMPPGFQSFHMGGMPGGMPAGFQHFGNHFSNGFGQQFRPNMPRKASNIQIPIPITLEQGYKGGKRKIEYTRENDVKKERITLTIEIPKGTGSSIKIVRQGFGNKKSGLVDGDLEIIVQVQPHKVFKVKQNHLILEKELEIGSSLLGITFGIVLLDGKSINIHIRGPIFDDDQKIVENVGLLDERGTRGSLIILLKINKNFSLTLKQKEMIEKYLPMNPHTRINGPTLRAEDLQQYEDSQHGQNVQCAQS